MIVADSALWRPLKACCMQRSARVRTAAPRSCESTRRRLIHFEMTPLNHFLGSFLSNINIKQEVGVAACDWTGCACSCSLSLSLTCLNKPCLTSPCLAPFLGQRGRGGERGDGAQPAGVSRGIPQGQDEPGCDSADQDPESVHVADGGLPAPQARVGGA